MSKSNTSSKEHEIHKTIPYGFRTQPTVQIRDNRYCSPTAIDEVKGLYSVSVTQDSSPSNA